MKTYFEIVQYIKNELAGHYPEGEISGFIKLIFDFFESLSPSQLHLKYKDEISKETIFNVENIISDLKKYIPIQYIIGEAEFYGIKLKVAPGVLIPRPETEELVDWIFKENKDKTDLSILDIGTGSGCIAIALAKNIHYKKFKAIDLSGKALQQAKKNNKLNRTDIKFLKKDILKISEKINKNKFDIIVSNPPYVTEKEKAIMLPNVLNHEPHEALFVEDDNPLKFYKAIGLYAKRNLKKEGQLFFEINELYGTDILNLLIGLKFDKIILKKDLNGRDRMVMAVRGGWVE